MATQTIPPFSVKAGTQNLGPVSPGAGLSNATISVDVTQFNQNAGQSLDLELYTSEDGVNWSFMTSSSPTSPILRQGIIQNTLTIGCNWGNTVAGPVLTTASTQVRGTLTSSIAFQSSGGSLTVS